MARRQKVPCAKDCQEDRLRQNHQKSGRPKPEALQRAGSQPAIGPGEREPDAKAASRAKKSRTARIVAGAMVATAAGLAVRKARKKRR